ncbi:hypothetical protein HYQ45_018578 [Verticillium longisporum]|uniref:NmrA-like domain-containing protein n=1 Tax=Verticillium longisporum TaxID=100787 RepID=A0A8I3AG77_VERLO|nr:hypothetical protein HYQ45_018578 [Verticillium longisporum]
MQSISSFSRKLFSIFATRICIFEAHSHWGGCIRRLHLCRWRPSGNPERNSDLQRVQFATPSFADILTSSDGGKLISWGGVSTNEQANSSSEYLWTMHPALSGTSWGREREDTTSRRTPAQRSAGSGAVVCNSAAFVGPSEPDVKLPFIAAEEDSGPTVKALIEEPTGKNVIGYRTWLTLPELVRTFANATGLKAEWITVPAKKALNPFPDELKLSIGEGFAYQNEFGYEGRGGPTIVHPRDLKTTLSLGTVGEYWKKQHWSTVFSA